MVAMKNLPAYIMVFALLVMSIANVAHADCMESASCTGVQASQLLDDAGDHDGEKQNAVCDCCATCGHHHHSQAAFSNGKTEHLSSANQKLRSYEGGNYFSQLHYPPSKPPKA